jgi:hypothetical protein
MASSVTVDHMPQPLISPRRNGTGRAEDDRDEKSKRRGKGAQRTYIVIAILDQESNALALQGFSISTSIIGKSLFGNGDIFQERSIAELTS